MTYLVGILGASGYLGVELSRLLAGHPEFEVAILTADSNAGVRVAEHFPSLAAVYGDMRYAPSDPKLLAGLDAVFCALPHGESQKLLPELIDSVDHIFDLGADFRLSAAEHEVWYRSAHACPELLDMFTYGLVELFRDQVRVARHVAVPGCYPTTVCLALAPLFVDALVDATSIIADCASGASGAGRGLKTTSLFGEINENFSVYGLLDHRHTGEMEHVLGEVGNIASTVLFTPHLAPMNRGIFATCYARPSANGSTLTTASLLARYREFYADDPFIVVTDEPSGTKATLGSNSVHLTIRHDSRTGAIVALGCLDNLVKGGSGQAVQCANVVFDLPETLGLPLAGITP
jgi:N-acetyl-gamma-glutamyl-phosphate reductase